MPDQNTSMSSAGSSAGVGLLNASHAATSTLTSSVAVVGTVADGRFACFPAPARRRAACSGVTTDRLPGSLGESRKRPVVGVIVPPVIARRRLILARLTLVGQRRHLVARLCADRGGKVGGKRVKYSAGTTKLGCMTPDPLSGSVLVAACPNHLDRATDYGLSSATSTSSILRPFAGVTSGRTGSSNRTGAAAALMSWAASAADTRTRTWPVPPRWRSSFRNTPPARPGTSRGRCPRPCWSGW